MSRSRNRRSGWWTRGVIAAAFSLAIGAISCSASAPAAQPDTDPRDTAAQPGTAASTTRSTATSTTQPDEPVTIAFSGDLLVHTSVANSARTAADGTGYDFRPMLAPVRAALSGADLAICHLETPLSPDNQNLSGYPVFNAPHELADAIAYAGYDSCSTASNHAYDRGGAGVAATLDTLDKSGVGHSGTARTPAEAARPHITQAGAATVALLDYTYPEGVGAAPAWAVRRIEPTAILTDATAARKSGADLIVVTLHWGEEYRTAPTAQQSALARQLLASSDVDLVVGGHAHVIQPVERVGDKFVVYGVGNFLSNQSAQCCPPNTQDGVMVTAHARPGHLGRWSVHQITFTPTWVDRTDYRVLPVAEKLDDPAVPAELRRQLSASWQRTVAAITSLGGSADTGVRADREPRTLSD